VDGLYWIDPLDAGGAFEAWCDMATDGGGYTLFKLSATGNQSAEEAETKCAVRGLQLFIPRSQSHLLSAWDVAVDAKVGSSGSDAYLSIMGIYPDSEGATCANTPLTSSNLLCDWVAGDGGAFWVSASTAISEPDGDNDILSSMAYSFDSSGVVTDYTDTAAPGATSNRFICSATDE
jgi:hypothetical protein